jgi:RNA polymerase sigma-70 factor (ECF subfamily)
MINDVQSVLANRARFEARVSDLEDIEELVRVHRSSVLKHAWWLLKDKDLAETVTQGCFMRAFNSRALYRGQCSVRTWLLAITTNLVRDRTRTHGFRFWKQVRSSAVDVCAIENRLACRRQSVEAEMLTREKLRHIWAAVDELPAKQRTVFMLRFAEEMDLSEIAEATGLHLGTVKSHLYRALRAVRLGLRQTGRSSAPRFGQLALETEAIGREQDLKVLSSEHAVSASNPSRRRHSRSHGSLVRTSKTILHDAGDRFRKTWAAFDAQIEKSNARDRDSLNAARAIAKTSASGWSSKLE